MIKRKALLPTDELKGLMEKWRASHRKPTTEECIAMLRREYLMTHQVYGDKYVRLKPGKRKREALAALCKRLYMIERTAEILKQRINLDGQRTIF